MIKGIYISPEKQDLWVRAERTAKLKGYRTLSHMLHELLDEVAFSKEQLQTIDSVILGRNSKPSKKTKGA